MKMKIGLNEALTGFTRSITTLDKREIAITSLPGEYVQHEGKSRKNSKNLKNKFCLKTLWVFLITKPHYKLFKHNLFDAVFLTWLGFLYKI